MSLLDKLSDKDSWERFYSYKCSLACKKTFTDELRAFIDNERFLPVCEMIRGGESFPLPQKSVISKLDTGKKRTVYSYPEDENTVLKLLTYLMLRHYDHIFSRSLYSFRPAKTAKAAVRRISCTEHIGNMYSYKADISDYFNSVPVERLLPQLKDMLSDDTELFSFLSALLTESRVIDRGKIISEQKGIMAGTPLSAFYANLYLKELDFYFDSRDILYSRYSDDIIVFAESEEELCRHAEYIRTFLSSAGLSLNPDKELFSSPSDGWSFLGFTYKRGRLDISDITVRKLKMKMRRKARALMRWRKRNGIPGEKAAMAFIRIFNRKLFEGGNDNELTWALWFFPAISSDEKLREIDRYAQEQIRFLISGTRKKSRYNVRYEDIKKLGYKSLVHEYYSTKKQQ